MFDNEIFPCYKPFGKKKAKAYSEKSKILKD
jgi:hypothetical protein